MQTTWIGYQTGFSCTLDGIVNVLVGIIIYLSRVLCLCVCVCVCVSQFVSERFAILLVLAIKLTKETRPRVRRGRDRGGEIGKRQIVEGGCEETFLCLSLNWEACRFTVPPAVALLNYISSGIFWRIFLPNWNFRGVFSLLMPFIYVPLPSGVQFACL